MPSVDRSARRRPAATAVTCVFLAAACPPYAAGGEESSTLLAGVAKVEITPTAEVATDPSGQKLALLDPLYARVLVLESGGVSVAIVSLDLAFFGSQRVVDMAKDKWKVDHVILSSTHTHSAMLPRGLVSGRDWAHADRAPAEVIDWPGLSADAWYAETEEKTVAAIGTAMQSRFPARLVVGKGRFESAYMAHNRRLVTDEGVRMMWENPHRLPTQPLDPTVGVIRIDDARGRPRALAVHYACHPVTLMGAGVVSRDYPGAMVDHVEGELGGDCMAMFLQGASGDIDPYDLHNLRGPNRLNIARRAGVSLARRALEISAGLESRGDGGAVTVAVEESLLTIPNRNGRGTTEVGLATFVVDRQLALVTVPGEPFIQLQLDLAARSPLPNTFLLGLAFAGLGTPHVIYVPTAQAVSEGGYGAVECSFLAVDAAARIVTQGASSIERLVAAAATATSGLP